MVAEMEAKLATIDLREIARDLLCNIEEARRQLEAEAASTTNKRRRAWLRSQIHRHAAMEAEAHQYIGTPAKGGHRN